MSSKVKLIFTLSLMLNVLLIGFGASAAYKKHQYKKTYKQKMVENISEQGRDVMRDTFKQARAEKKEFMKNSQETRDQMREIISAEEFDVQAYDELALKMMEDHTVQAKKKSETVKAMLEQMSQEDRKAIAHKMAGMLGGHKHRSKNKDGKRDYEKVRRTLGSMDEQRMQQWREQRQKRKADLEDRLPRDLPPSTPAHKSEGEQAE